MGLAREKLKSAFLPPGVPPRKLCPILLILFNEGLTSSSLMAYVSYMVVDLGATDDLKDVGYYAGFMFSIYFVCQFFSSFVIGVLSDRIGRRPVLLVGTFGLFLSTILFGFSWNYRVALIARALNGLLNGNIGVAKTYLGELTDSSNRVQTFAYFGLMYGLGGVIGSTLGGLTARPAHTMPKIFSEKGLFGKFPYLLPNLLVGACVLLSLVLGAIFITENTRKQTRFTKNDSMEAHLVSGGGDEGETAERVSTDSAPEAVVVVADTHYVAVINRARKKVFARVQPVLLPLYTCVLCGSSTLGQLLTLF
eukprot:TRINITY_DN3119_c0_g1_i1.p1 TRINITY_DN3119_c0_g1~~TRINITY_DN3119_c0_g1_i1.p1  ORF type:complete len:322 (-),score=46.30 TRINITY_DN3119_c0_g1_i1:802-1725(-)